MKKYIFIILLFVSCGTSQPRALSQSQQIEYMRDYFFCRCLDHAYSEKVTKYIWQNDISKGVLFDIGELGAYYQELDSLARIKAEAIKPSQITDFQNEKPVILRCLEYSRNLDISSILKDINKLKN